MLKQRSRRLAAVMILFCLSGVIGISLWMLSGGGASNNGGVSAEKVKIDRQDATEGEQQRVTDDSKDFNQATTSYVRWGGAIHSVGPKGEFFFDRSVSHQFQQQTKAFKKYVIKLKSRSLLPQEDASISEVLTDASNQAVYLQFHSHPTATLKDKLRTAGINIQGYLDGYAWHALGSHEALKKVRAWKEVRSFARIDPRDKMAPAVFHGKRPSYAEVAHGKLKFMALPYHHIELSDWMASVQAHDVSTSRLRNGAFGPRVELICKLDNLYAVAALPTTRYVEFTSPPVISRDSTLDKASNVDDVRDDSPMLSGDGITVAVREVDRIQAHDDFSARYTEVDAAGNLDGGHATAVAGQVGGSGVGIPLAKGIAPKVKILGYEILQESEPFLVDDIVDAFEGILPAGRTITRISNHSYGPNQEGAGAYQTISANWDAEIKFKDLLVFFASGEFAPVGFKQIDFLVGAKNTICVSSANDAAHAGDSVPLTAKANGISSFADHGPMADGRVKPDLVANGDSVTLLSGSSGSQVSSGTSFSCPAVSGMAALLFEHYNTAIGGEPSAALAKALLLNCATDLGLPGPDATYGYGMANIEAVIRTIDNYVAAPSNRPFHDTTVGDANTILTNTGDSLTYTINIGKVSEFKVMLVWMDDKGDPAAQNAIVNDLDLEILRGLDPSLLPYSLDPNNPSAAATNTVRNAVDNVEQIILTNPASGTYTIKVTATNLVSPQDFALVFCKDAVMEATLTSQAIAPGTTQSGISYLPVTGGKVSFTANVTGGTPPYILDWDFDGNATTIERTDLNVMTVPFKVTPDIDFSGGARDITINLKVTDSSPDTPLVAIASGKVSIIAPPTAIITATPTSGEAPLEVFLSGGNANSILKTYDWVFGDASANASTTTPNTTHVYNAAGTFTAQLTITDLVGQASAPSTTTIQPIKRRVESFPHKLRASLNFKKNKATLILTTIVSELALTRKEAKDQIKNLELEGVVYRVILDPDGTRVELGPFTLDKRGRSKTEDAIFKLLSSRKGQIQVKSSNPDIFAAFDNLGMNAATPGSDKNNPATFFSVPVEFDQNNVTYRTTFQVIWVNPKGTKGKAKQ